MTIKVAINGYGRIGRNILRAHYEGGKKHDLQIVAINDLGDAKTNAHLPKYDTAHGTFPGTVEVDGDKHGRRTATASRWSPSATRPSCRGRRWASTWCSSAPASSPPRKRPARTCRPGAKKVIISAPGGKDVDAHRRLRRQPPGAQGRRDTVISNASCTTNCLAPLVKPLDDRIGVVTGLMTTIHSYTNDQVLTDVFHEDLRRARSATHNMIPTKTGAAAAVGLVLPELNGKLDGFAIRVPTINVSIVDLSFVGEEADHGGRGQRGDEAGVRDRPEGHPRLQHRAAGVGRTSTTTRPARSSTPTLTKVSGHAGEGVVLVRQRVGLLQPHARRRPSRLMTAK